MQLDLDKAVNVFRKAKRVREEIREYCLAGDQPALPLAELIRTVNRMYELDISIKEVSYGAQFVRGMVLRYQGRACIFVSKDQPEDWKRFTAAKELCHLINDEEEDWSANGADTLVGLLTQLSFDDDKLARKVEQSEVFAELAAIELLYPFHERQPDMLSVADGTLSYAKIANFHKIPDALVQQYAQPDRMELYEIVWREIDAQDAST